MTGEVESLCGGSGAGGRKAGRTAANIEIISAADTLCWRARLARHNGHSAPPPSQSHKSEGGLGLVEGCSKQEQGQLLPNRCAQ